MMYSLAVLASLLLTAEALALPIDSSSLYNRQSSCAPVHLLVARGSTESPGDGQLASLANLIIRANPGATQEAIVYPALLSPYGPSVGNGTKAVQSQLTAYVQKCPNAKIVLLGYSQGAQIVGDALCGGDSAGSGPVTPPISSSISGHGAYLFLSWQFCGL